MSNSKTGMSNSKTEKVDALHFPSAPEAQKFFQENKITDPKFYGLTSPEIDAETKERIRTELAAALAVREVDQNVPAVFRGTRRCVAFVGEHRCERAPISGGFACAIHADAITYAEAKRRLLFLIDPALQCLFEICTSPFSKDDSRIRAAKTILDRTLPVQSKQEIEVTQKRAHSSMTIEQMKERLEICRVQIFALAEKKRLAAELEREAIVDAEVVEDKQEKQREEENAS